MENNFQSDNESKGILYCQYNFDIKCKSSFAEIENFLVNRAIDGKFIRKVFSVIWEMWYLLKSVSANKQRLPHLFIKIYLNKYLISLNSEVEKNTLYDLESDINFVNDLEIQEIINYYKILRGNDLEIRKDKIITQLMYLKAKTKENIIFEYDIVFENIFDFYLTTCISTS